MPEILLFVYYFFTTGLFAVGGGLATLPFLYEIGQKTGWYNALDVANMVAIAQSTPGPTGINMSTYVGFNQFGMFGAILGPLAIVLPSLIVVISISKILDKFKESKLVKDVFYGLRPASTGLILAAAFSVITISLFDFGNANNLVSAIRWPAMAVAFFVFILNKWKKPHPIILIALAAIIGIVFQI